MAVAVRASQVAVAGIEPCDAGRLFEEHYDRLLAYCVRFLGSRAEAEDAVQTTFLYAHRALERGVVPENEHAWLHAIAKNACRWHVRTLARRGSLSTDLDLDAFPAHFGDAEEMRDLREELDDALASIPENQREAFVLREVHGLAAHEVADHLGMTPTATYALLTRARRSLARTMTASRRRPVLGINFGHLLFKLKALFAGSTAKVVATTVVAGSVAIGGVAVEQAVQGDEPSRPVPAARTDAGGVGAGVVPVVGNATAGATRASGTMDSSRSVPSPAGTGPFGSVPRAKPDGSTGAADGVPPELSTAGSHAPGDAQSAGAPSADAPLPLPIAALPKVLPDVPPPDDLLAPVEDEVLDPLPLPDIDLPPVSLEDPTATLEDATDTVDDVTDVVDDLTGQPNLTDPVDDVSDTLDDLLDPGK